MPIAMTPPRRNRSSAQATISSHNSIFSAATATRRHCDSSHDCCEHRPSSADRVFNSTRCARNSRLDDTTKITRKMRDTQRCNTLQRTDPATGNAFPERDLDRCYRAITPQKSGHLVIMRCFKMIRKFASWLHGRGCTVPLLDDHTPLRRNGTALRFECARAAPRCANRNNPQGILDEAPIITLRASTMIGSSRLHLVCSDSA
ncbi:hypothetical protein [Bradyrhizobium sp. 2TAF24]|uniref:hypothetical protein n=1 Tax=Bradyrhizobium sp. 2TAF24 TaxID=3233011 RepID=UPI003F905A85